MTKIVNLRQARKQRERSENRKQGDVNAAKFGEARSLRQIREAESARDRRKHDAHRRDDD